jgi:hypothetical protein
MRLSAEQLDVILTAAAGKLESLDLVSLEELDRAIVHGDSWRSLGGSAAVRSVDFDRRIWRECRQMQVRHEGIIYARAHFQHRYYSKVPDW